MSERTPVTDTDLQAYIDDQLDPPRRAEVEAYLAAQPEAAARVRRYLEIDRALRTLYEPVLAEPLPPRFAARPRYRALPRRAAAALCWMTLGAGIAWILKPVIPPATHTALTEQLVRPAAFAHRVYAAEQLHPVEVRAEHEQHLIEWLSRRLRTSLKAPNLAEHGYELVGGRLLPSTDRMAAQFMYQNQRGERVTLYIRRGAWSHNASAFRYAQDGEVGTLYWIDGSFGYALSGEVPKQALLALAEAVYRQLENP